MSELEYKFVKGKGWVLAPPFKEIRYDKGDGYVLVCENRNPDPGEPCFTEGSFENTANALGRIWNLRMLKEHVKDGRQHKAGYDWNRPPEETGVCTFRLEKL